MGQTTECFTPRQQQHNVSHPVSNNRGFPTGQQQLGMLHTPNNTRDVSQSMSNNTEEGLLSNNLSINNNNNNGYLERLARTGPKRLHVL